MGHQLSWRQFVLILAAFMLVFAFNGSGVDVAAQDDAAPIPVFSGLIGQEGGLEVQTFGDTLTRDTALEAIGSRETPQLNSGDSDFQRELPDVRGITEEVRERGEVLTGTVTVYVELEGEPAAALLSSTRGNGGGEVTSAQRAQIAQRASQLDAQLTTFSNTLSTQFGAQTIGRMRITGFGLVMNIDASDIDAISKLPGVANVHLDTIGELDNANGVPLIGGDLVWEFGPYTGAGVSIGIIDSGIDYTHADFGGSGLVATYNGNDTSTIADIGYDGSRVVGGYDFVGDAWTGGTTFFPDDDPMDCNGHGTHVAGTAAGSGVVAGATYAGPYDTTTPFASMDIGPGVAPQADLYALRIGGCGNAVSFIAGAQAVEFAVDPNGDFDTSDHLDVTNSSVGNGWGVGSILEPFSDAMDYASFVGVVMVTSAGNSGDTFYVSGDPGAAASAIATASSVTDSTYSGLQLDSGDGSYGAYPTVIAANPSNGGALGTFGSYNLRIPTNLSGGNSYGCDANDYAAFAGETAVFPWDDGLGASGCGSGTRMTNAVNSGNVSGIIIVSYNPDFPFINLACTFSGGPSPIPCVSILNVDGLNLLNAPGSFTVTFDDTLTATLPFSIADQLSGFSSRGPRTPTSALGSILKPNITAPGDFVVSAGMGTGTDSLALGGTSMASPHVTGSMALLVQQHPGLWPEELKAIAMNGAQHDLWTDPGMTGDNYGVSRVGAGRIDIYESMENSDPIYATSTDDPFNVSVSFGLQEFSTATSIQQTVTIVNYGALQADYDNIYFQQMNDTSAASISVSPSSISVPAFSTATVTVTLNLLPNQSMPHLPSDATTAETQAGVLGDFPRDWLDEEGGYLVINDTSGDPPTLRVPVHALPRQVSEMSTVDNPLPVGPLEQGFTVMQLQGNEILTGGNFPYDIMSIASPFELIYEDTADQPFYFDSADVEYVGVTSDYPLWLAITGDPDAAMDLTWIHFAIVTDEVFGAPNLFDVWFEFAFDNNEDFAWETFAYTFDTGWFAGADITNSHLVYIDDGSPFWGGNFGFAGGLNASIPNWFTSAEYDMYTMNNDVILMTVPAADLGLTGSNTDFLFSYYSLPYFYLADITFDIYYDVANPQLNFNDAGFVCCTTDLAVWPDLDGGIIPVDYNIQDINNPPSILLLHHHNGTDNRAEIIPLLPQLETDVQIAKVVDNPLPLLGETVVFTVGANNIGPAQAVDMVLTDTLPNGLTYVSDDCAGTTTVNGQVITCDLTGFYVPAGTSYQWNITASADGGFGTYLTNTGSLTSLNASITETDATNNSATATVCVGGDTAVCDTGTPPGGGGGSGTAGDGTGIFIDVAANQAIVRPGDDLGWTVTLTNNTGATLSNVAAALDFTPGSVEILGADISAGTITYGTQVSRNLFTTRFGRQFDDIRQGGALQAVVNMVVGNMNAGDVVLANINTRVLGNFTGLNIVGTGNATSDQQTGTDAAVVAIVTQLPATGETPAWRDDILLLLVVAGLATLAAGSTLFVRRRNQA